MAARYVGYGVGGVVATYAAYALIVYADNEQKVRRCDSSAQQLSHELASFKKKKDEVAEQIKAESKAAKEQEQVVHQKQEELQHKQAEVEQLAGQLAAATESLAKQLSVINSARQTSNDLAAKVLANESAIKEANQAAVVARKSRDEAVSKLNPLTNPKVQAFFSASRG